MNNTTWTKTPAALLTSVMMAVALIGPTAEAQQTGPVPMTVSTTISSPCSASTNGLFQFPNYTTGQSGAALGQMPINIICPTSSTLGPMPVTLDFVPTAPAGKFEMSQGGSGAAPFLTYQLCDTSCTTGTVYGSGTAGPSISVTSGASAQTYTLHGRIAGGQSPAASATAYKQVVDGFINF